MDDRERFGVVEFDDNGKATVTGEVDEAVAEELVASCPVGAISK